jgi:putative ABC transport system substrate-binding protein
MSFGPTSQTCSGARRTMWTSSAGREAWDIPVEPPPKFDLVINLATVKALGLTIPESFLLKAARAKSSSVVL